MHAEFSSGNADSAHAAGCGSAHSRLEILLFQRCQQLTLLHKPTSTLWVVPKLHISFFKGLLGPEQASHVLLLLCPRVSRDLYADTEESR
jgi:hypothetical protein